MTVQRTKWEYLMVTASEDALNDLGLDGWELVSGKIENILDVDNGQSEEYFVGIMKRQIDEALKE